MSSDQPESAFPAEAEAEELARFREEWRREVEVKREVENRERLTASSAATHNKNKEKVHAKGKEQRVPYGTGERAQKGLGKTNVRVKGGAEVEAAASFASLRLSPPKPKNKDPFGEGTTSSMAEESAHEKRPTPAVTAAATREGIVPCDAGSKAVELYAQAVEFEQSGQLNEALHLYRKAYKLDGAVEKAYRKKELEFEKEAMSATVSLTVTDPSLPIELSGAPEVYVFSDTKQYHPDYVTTRERDREGKTTASPPVATTPEPGPISPADVIVVDELSEFTDPLSLLVKSWDSSDLIFTPEEETYPLHLSLLPDELFQPIFSFMDVQTLERFGSTCKKLRVLSQRAEKWKRLCERLYKPPVLPEPIVELERTEDADGICSGTSATNSSAGSLLSTEAPSRADPYEPTQLTQEGQDQEEALINMLNLESATRALARARRKQMTELARRHAFDWRTTFLEERRVRYDGVYISVCHYVRAGQSDLAWVNITHLITYHRFLRFYPDGSVISLLTTDHPVDVVHTIKPSFRAKGLLFGTWGLSTMKTDKGVELPKLEVRSLLEPGITPKYEFEMDLSLKCSTRGRWNKLEMLTYQSINLASGEALGLSLKHQKPFFFSKVRSYREAL